MNIIFMGTPDYAEKILEKILEEDDINVAAVYTQPDKPVGRKKIMTPPQVKVLAKTKNIPVYQPIKLRDQSIIDELITIKCDFIVVAAYGQILPPAILDHAPCINLHASILPRYRGASPIQQALINNDNITGVTAMLMEEGLDTGSILKIEKVAISKDIMVTTLFENLTNVASLLTINVLQNFKSFSPKKQDETEATLCKKITKLDGLISFDNANDIYNKYRAFTPWPGIYLENGIKLKQIELMNNNDSGEAGKILAIDKESIQVSCTLGRLKIYKVQPQSKKEMSVIAYINGKRLTIEDTFL